MNNTLLALVIFLGFFGLFMGLLIGSAVPITNIVNQTGLIGNNTVANATIILGTQTTPPICEAGTGLFGNIPFISQVTDFFGCFASMVMWLYAFVFLDTDIIWLQLILTGVSAVILYNIARLIKPGGT